MCGTKYDQFERLELSAKTVLAKALRCMALANGAHLVFSSHRPSRSGIGAGQHADASGKKLKSLLMHTLFAGHDRKLCAARLLLGSLLLQICIERLNGCVRQLS